MNKLMRFMLEPYYRFKKLDERGFYQKITDEQYLKKHYKARFGKELNLEVPTTFSEKIQWLKLYNRKPIYTTMADKYAVREYVSSLIGEQYLIPLVGGPWKSFGEIDFDALPNQFVLKCTHDSGGMVIVRNKEEMDYNSTKKIIEYSLSKNYYYHCREWSYKAIQPQIIAEEYMQNDDGSEVKDYKFMMFNSVFKCLFVCTNRFSGQDLNVTFFSPEWLRMPFERKYHSDTREIECPQTYKEMIEIAHKLSADTVFSRIDLYEINGKVYFGEITLYPGSGMEVFDPIEWDAELGSWLELPLHGCKQ